MGKLNVELHYKNNSTDIMRVIGFTEQELSELNSMTYHEMKETVLDALDKRNSGLGSQWKCGFGVFQMWISNGAVYVEIGNSCD